MSTQKRIHSVTIRRITDDSPDTSYLGEYSNTPSGTYSIDRKHTVECVLNTGAADEGNGKLCNAKYYLDAQLDNSEAGTSEYRNINDAIWVLTEASESLGCDCDELGGYSRGECRYFNTSGNYDGESIDIIRQNTILDYQRMQDYNNEGWYYMGVKAQAEVIIGGVTQTLSSGGVWGVESDSEESFLKETGNEELSQLRAVLYEVGFSKRAIATAVKGVQTEEGN